MDRSLAILKIFTFFSFTQYLISLLPLNTLLGGFVYYQGTFLGKPKQMALKGLLRVFKA